MNTTQSLKVRDQSQVKSAKPEVKYRAFGANIVEAKASASRREFVNYFQIALKSGNEAKYWLAMMRELVPNKNEVLNKFLREADEITKIVGTSVLTMKGKTKIA